MRRIVTALVGLPILWAVIKLCSPLVWFLLLLVATGIATAEMLSLLRLGGHRVYTRVGVVAGMAVLVPFIEPRIDTALPIVFAGAASIILGAKIAGGLGDAVDGALSTVFSVAFVGLNLGYQVALRSIAYGAVVTGPNWSGVAPVQLRLTTSTADALGQDLLCLLLFVVWSGDSAAYFIGSRFGRRKLAARLSPRKTVEGAVAGIAASAIAAAIAHYWFFHRLPLGHALMIGLLLGTAGIIGDLAESVVKRAAGAKDSAALLPGHGGLLDRVDSLLLAAPALYYYYRFVLAGIL